MASRRDEPDNLPFEKRRQLLIQHWLQFESELGAGSDGSEELCEILFNAPFKKCSKCFSADVVRVATTRYIRCNDCRAKSSLTANTLFHNARRPKAWLGAIRLMESGVEFSAHMLSVIAKISYATAWEIMKKLDEVLSMNLDSQSLFVSSKIFENVYLKRSRETPAREHPRSEQRAAEKEQRQRNKNKVAGCSDRELKILRAIGENCVGIESLSEQLNLSSAVISAHLMMLELAGLLEQLDGAVYRRKLLLGAASKPTGQVKDLVKKFVKNLRLSKRGISRKYVHLYVARFWCIVDRERWREGALLAECLKFQLNSECIAVRDKAPLVMPFPSLVA